MTARRRRLNVFMAVLVIATGAASSAIAIYSLIGHGTGRAAAGSPYATILRLRGRDLASGRSLSTVLRGRAVIVEFWSTACPGCRQVAERLERLAASDRRAALVGVDEGDEVAAAHALVGRLGWRHLSGVDPAASFAKTLALRRLPTTLLLDRQHRVVGRAVGVKGLKTLDKRLDQLPY